MTDCRLAYESLAAQVKNLAVFVYYNSLCSDFHKKIAHKQTAWQQTNHGLLAYGKKNRKYTDLKCGENHTFCYILWTLFFIIKGILKSQNTEMQAWDAGMICRHKVPWTRITQIKQIGIKSPFGGDPCELMKCKATPCHTVESKKNRVRGHWTSSANLQWHQSWAGPKLMARPQEPRWSIAKAAAPLLWWGLALCRGQHTACSGTNTNISWLCSTVPCHTCQLWGRQTCPRWSVEISFGLWCPPINIWTTFFCVAHELPISTPCQNNPF